MTELDWRINPGRKIATLELREDSTVADMQNAIRRLPDVPGWQNDFDIIIEIRPDATLEDFTADNLVQHKDFMRVWNAENRKGHSPRTALVCSDDLKRTIPSLWEAMTRAGWMTAIGVFETREAAYRWIADK